MSLERRTPMPRGKELKRGTGMPSRSPENALKRGGLSRAPRARNPKPRERAAPGMLGAAVALVLAGEATCAQAARICGLDDGHVTAVRDQAAREFRRLVMARDGYLCQAQAAKDCTGRATDVQHRVKRGSGGNANPAITFGLTNGVGLCRPCHDLCDRAYDAVMYDRGFWRRSYEDPALVPVVIATPGGLARLWLLPDGGRSTMPPEGIAA